MYSEPAHQLNSTVDIKLTSHKFTGGFLFVLFERPEIKFSKLTDLNEPDNISYLKYVKAEKAVTMIVNITNTAQRGNNRPWTVGARWTLRETLWWYANLK